MLRISTLGLIVLSALWMSVAPALARAEFAGARAAVFEPEAHSPGHSHSGVAHRHALNHGEFGKTSSLPSLGHEKAPSDRDPGCCCCRAPESVTLITDSIAPRSLQLVPMAVPALRWDASLFGIRSIRCRRALLERARTPFLQELAPLRI